jgi:hypothetical protein
MIRFTMAATNNTFHDGSSEQNDQSINVIDRVFSALSRTLSAFHG